jgi:hypothetical protein
MHAAGMRMFVEVFKEDEERLRLMATDQRRKSINELAAYLLHLKLDEIFGEPEPEPVRKAS